MRIGRLLVIVLVSVLLPGEVFSGDTEANKEREYVLEAREYFLNEDYISAERKCRMAIEENPGSFYANLLLGSIIGKLPGREEESLAYYEQALEIDANHPAIYGEMSALYGRLGLDDEMINVLERGVGVFPKDATLNYALGLAHFMKKNDPGKAVKYFTTALAGQPKNPKLIYITGLSEILGGNMAKALEHITHLREIRSEDLAVKLESVMRERYGVKSLDVSGAVDSYIERSPSERPAAAEDRASSTGAIENGVSKTDVNVSPGTRTVRGTGTVTIKQTYDFEKETSAP
jgi:tetratricopeptide (TPR) repeat protein